MGYQYTVGADVPGEPGWAIVDTLDLFDAQPIVFHTHTQSYVLHKLQHNYYATCCTYCML